MASIRTLLARGKKVDPEYVALAPRVAAQVAPPTPAAEVVFCSRCGTRRFRCQSCPTCIGPRRPRLQSNKHPGPNVRGAKNAAARIGVSVEEWQRRMAAGERHCGHHGTWHPKEAFGPQKQGHCLAAREERYYPGRTPLLGPNDRWCIAHKTWHAPEAFTVEALAAGPGGARCVAWQSPPASERSGLT